MEIGLLNLEGNMHFEYIQLVRAIPNSWKNNIQQTNSNKTN